MIQLQEKEIAKIAEISGVSFHNIQKLCEMRIINETLAFDYIIRKDFEDIRRTGKYRPGHIITRLSRLYCVSEDKVKSAIYRKHNRCYYCEKCNKRIPKSMFDRNEGLCDSCMADTIEV